MLRTNSGGSCAHRCKIKANKAQPAAWAATFTTNRFAAAPVELGKALLRRGGPLQAELVNSGNANAATGAEGERRARSVAAAVARVLALPAGRVLVSSTGIIGRPLPAEKIVAAVPEAVRTLAADGGGRAARAIMTTDTFVKEAAVELRSAGRPVRIGGMTKGAGMIHPCMASMLCYITTDAAVSQGLLRRLLADTVEKTFNRIDIDVDQSTNDTVVFMAGHCPLDAGVNLAPRQSRFVLCPTGWEVGRLGRGAVYLTAHRVMPWSIRLWVISLR